MRAHEPETFNLQGETRMTDLDYSELVGSLRASFRARRTRPREWRGGERQKTKVKLREEGGGVDTGWGEGPHEKDMWGRSGGRAGGGGGGGGGVSHGL